MPTVLRKDGHRFFFFSNEGNEPRHIHVEHAEAYAKLWLNPVELAFSTGFTSGQLTKLRKLVEENLELFNNSWDEHFS
jgi:hypothetical protein